MRNDRNSATQNEQQHQVEKTHCWMLVLAVVVMMGVEWKLDVQRGMARQREFGEIQYEHRSSAVQPKKIDKISSDIGLGPSGLGRVSTASRRAVFPVPSHDIAHNQRHLRLRVAQECR